MTRRLRTRSFVLFLMLALAGCAPTAVPEAPAPAQEPAVAPEPAPTPAARPRPTRPLTASRPITDMPRRTFGFEETGVWISNELEGGRVSDAYLYEDSLYIVEIHPENAPINNSAWYAFKAWSRTPQTISVTLVYQDGDHRYWPKTRRADEWWTPMDSAMVARDTAAGSATLTLRLSPDTLWVAGQEMLTSTFFDQWTDSLAALPWATRRTIATTPQDQPIRMLEMGDTASLRHVVIISRQHPPEVSGTWALLAFVETLAADTELARRFRDAFRVHVVPLMNPDGVDLGHWRHNTGGIDLNRDWGPFLQPETRAVAQEIRRLLAGPHDLWFAFDFHSTQEDVFYTLDRSLVTDPPGLTDRWLGFIDAAIYLYEVNDDPSALRSPTSRNWFYAEFGAPALIYEVGDETPRPLIRQVAETAAEGTMRILLDEAGG